MRQVLTVAIVSHTTMPITDYNTAYSLNTLFSCNLLKDDLFFFPRGVKFWISPPMNWCFSSIVSPVLVDLFGIEDLIKP
jgi:hypothetical protein